MAGSIFASRDPIFEVMSTQHLTIFLVVYSLATRAASATDTNEPNKTISRIYMEDPATKQYPFMVALEISDQAFCCGALLDNQNIVTAAHCALIIRKETSKVRAILGAFNLKDKNNVVRGVTQCWIPKRYKPGNPTSKGDISICRLDKAVTFSAKVDRICISKTYAERVKVMLIGFGRVDGIMGTDYLQYAMGKTLLNSECKERKIAKSQVCAKLYNKKGKRVEQANGDSGGPLFMTSGKKYNLIGTVSYNYDLAASNGGAALPDLDTPGYYSRGSSFVKFLSKNAQIDTAC